MPPSPYECMPDMILSAGVVKTQFLKINIDKASGPDLVPATKFSVHDVASELAVLLSSLFQQFYDSGTLSHSWRSANDYAIFKKGSEADPKICSPVVLRVYSLVPVYLLPYVPSCFSVLLVYVCYSFLAFSAVMSYGFLPALPW